MNKSVLITGASAGLGEGMAMEFAKQGYDLALCARNMQRLEQLQQQLQASYPAVRVFIRALDVNNHSQVFAVFRAFQQDLGKLDRIIVNAGLGKGQPLGTGRFDANLQTATTNFTSALAQCEAAMEIFREQNAGHLVAISSFSAVRGMPGNITTYAATKAGLATLCNGLRYELMRKKSPIKVSILYPGYIRTAMNEQVKNTPFLVEREPGCKAMVKAIEMEKPEAYVPAWPWLPLSFVLRRLPAKLYARMV